MCWLNICLLMNALLLLMLIHHTMLGPDSQNEILSGSKLGRIKFTKDFVSIDILFSLVHFLNVHSSYHRRPSAIWCCCLFDGNMYLNDEYKIYTCLLWFILKILLNGWTSNQSEKEHILSISFSIFFLNNNNHNFKFRNSHICKLTT